MNQAIYLDDASLLAPRDVGRLLGGLTTSTVIHLARTGRLPHLRDSAGRRLFRKADVLRLAAERRRQEGR